MSRLNLPIILLGLLVALGCPGRSREPGSRVGPTPATAAQTGPERVTCVECAGLGRSPHSGDERPCFLCDGRGRCGVCRGDGHHRDGTCAACEGSGKCPDCAGDGMISGSSHDHGFARAPVPGACPVCFASLGQCPECGGSGMQSATRPCVFCRGERWCPECRGSGSNRLCGGEGVCPLCRGRGELEGASPAPGKPPLTIHLTDGATVHARLLAPPDRLLAIERDQASKVIREAVSLSTVLPSDALLAFRLTCGDAGPAPRVASARFLLSAGPEFLSAARHDVRAARVAGASDIEVDLLAARIDNLQSDWLLRQAKAAIEADPVRATLLLNTLHSAFPKSGHAKEVERLRADLSGSRGKDAELPAEVRERRAAAEAGRIRRLARRAEEWRVRAEDILSGTAVPEDGFLRAHQAAFEAWRDFSQAANRAAPELAEALLENGGQARTLRIRAVVGLASRLLERGYLERARALSVLALSLDPDDAGATQFVAEIEGALGRRANEVKDR